MCVCVCVCAVHMQREAVVLMNMLSVLQPDGSRPCLIGFYEDSNPSGVTRGVTE